MDFCDGLIDFLDIAYDKTRVSVIQFSRQTAIYTTMDYDKNSVQSAFTSMRNNQMRSWTYTHNTIYFAWDNIMSYGRYDVPQIFLMLTDGACTMLGMNLYDYDTGAWDYPAEQLLHNFGITSFAIGIGTSTSLPELERIATDPDSDFLYDLNTYDELNELYMRITNAVCQVGNNNRDNTNIDMANVALPSLNIPDNTVYHTGWLFGNIAEQQLTGGISSNNNYNGGATWRSVNEIPQGKPYRSTKKKPTD